MQLNTQRNAPSVLPIHDVYLFVKIYSTDRVHKFGNLWLSDLARADVKGEKKKGSI